MSFSSSVSRATTAIAAISDGHFERACVEHALLLK